MDIIIIIKPLSALNVKHTGKWNELLVAQYKNKRAWVNPHSMYLTQEVDFLKKNNNKIKITFIKGTHVTMKKLKQKKKNSQISGDVL